MTTPTQATDTAARETSLHPPPADHGQHRCRAGGLSGVPIHFGGDGPESGMEALYQGANGSGYDQNCNGIYDSATDVKPFLSSADDAFIGAGGQSYNSTDSGGGFIGGFGFRDYALPVMVYATDNYLRDPEDGYGTPGGCPIDAGASDVIDAINELGGYAVGISTSSWGGSLPGPQMEMLAEATGSLADTDGDGVADDLLVFEWSSSSAAFRSTVVDAIEDLINSIRFSWSNLRSRAMSGALSRTLTLRSTTTSNRRQASMHSTSRSTSGAWSRQHQRTNSTPSP